MLCTFLALSILEAGGAGVAGAARGEKENCDRPFMSVMWGLTTFIYHSLHGRNYASRCDDASPRLKAIALVEQVVELEKDSVLTFHRSSTK
ncbi:MAG: hypothetical protein KAF91_27100 [Nostoc sp. TH1S01]|nr:hypothetical protein [Nostoc sp. TH1S01]